MDEILIEVQFAEFIKEKRIALGLSYREMAFLVYGQRIRGSYISGIEKGTRKITITTMQLILNKLNCRITFNEI